MEPVLAIVESCGSASCWYRKLGCTDKVHPMGVAPELWGDLSNNLSIDLKKSLIPSVSLKIGLHRIGAPNGCSPRALG
jgi:hypothetical protein